MAYYLTYYLFEILLVGIWHAICKVFLRNFDVNIQRSFSLLHIWKLLDVVIYLESIEHFEINLFMLVSLTLILYWKLKNFLSYFPSWFLFFILLVDHMKYHPMLIAVYFAWLFLLPWADKDCDEETSLYLKFII